MHRTPMYERAHAARGMGGFSIVELMIGLVLGLIVIGSATAIFTANKKVYASSETINRIQENGRVAFELMARDVREAAGSPCGLESNVVNLLNGKSGTWWDKFGDGLRGYEGGSAPGATGATAPVTGALAGTDAIDLYGSTALGDMVTITEQDTPSAEVKLTSVAGINDNDIVIACNTKYSIIFQVTNVQGSSLGLVHGGGNNSPGNCGQDFQFQDPTNCSGASGSTTYCFTSNSPANSNACDKRDNIPAVLTKVGGMRWYVASNGRGSNSLYRAIFNPNSMTTAPTIATTEEIAEGVSDMQLRYRLKDGTSWINASSTMTGNDWKRVIAVEIKVVAEGVKGALEGNNLKGTDNQVFKREFTHVVSLRNREGLL